MDLQALRKHGIRDRDIITVVRSQYRKYDKFLHSKVLRPDDYGIRLLNSAERLIEDAFSETAPAPRKTERRRLPYRIQCRLSKDDYRRLQQAFARLGYETIQIGLSKIIQQFLDEQEL